MDKKKIAGILIGLFVVISIVVLVAKEITKNNFTTEDNVTTKQAVELKHHLKVFYFHGNARCLSCKKIEAYTRETITSGYKPENNQYVEQYQITTKQVIVAEFENGKEKRWKNLDRVWELFGDKESFQSYQELEIAGWLNEIKK